MRRARNVGLFRRFVVTLLVWTKLNIPHGAAGRLRARRSARPCDNARNEGARRCELQASPRLNDPGDAFARLC